MKVKHTSTHAHTQATRLGAKSKRLSARPTMLLSAIALVCSGSSAFAACDTATITGNCADLVLPSTAGNVNYRIDTNAAVSANTAQHGVKIDGAIGSFTNDGQVVNNVTNHSALEVSVNGVVNGNLVSNGSMTSTSGAAGLMIKGTVNGDVINNGLVSTDGGYGIPFQIDKGSNVTGSFTNTATGVIRHTKNHAVEVDANLTIFRNAGLITSTGPDGWAGAGFFSADIGTVINSGEISSTANSPALFLGKDFRSADKSTHIGTLINTGSLLAKGATTTNGAVYIVRVNSTLAASVGTITNMGTIRADNNAPGIENSGTLGTLNNYQGANGSHGSALKYSRFLPTNYNMIAYGDRYGQLSVSDLDVQSGTMMFGVFGGDAAHGIAASKLKTGVYQNVVMGAVQGDFTNQFDTSKALTDKYGVSGAAFGNYNGVVWMLTDATYRQGDGLSWDLSTLNFGLDMAEPQRALLEQRQSAIRTGLDQDCKAFDKDKLCVWVQARRSGLGDAQESAGVVTVAKRINDDVRLGGFVDMPLSGNEVRGVQMKSRSPVLGLFAAYSEGHTGTGLQARAAVAYQDGKADITRDSLFDAATQLTGSAKVVSQGASLRLGWGTELNKQVLATPYVGVRSAQSKRGAYSDGAGAADPLNFAAYGERRVTSSLGLDFDVNRGQDLSYRLGLGVDRDTTRTLDPFQATSSLLGELSYSNQPMARAKRVFGAAGVNYIIEPNRTLTLDLRASQMDFGNKLGYAMQVGYRMAF